LYSGSELWRLRLFSFGGYGLALAVLALVVFGPYDSYKKIKKKHFNNRLMVTASRSKVKKKRSV